MFNFLFDNPTDPIKDGPVTIQFEIMEDRKIKATYIVDFSKTNLSPHEAANVQKAIVAVLRSSLGVELSKLR